MPFEPGHPYYPSANGAAGKSAARARAERDVALWLREQGASQRVLALMIEAATSGIDPTTKEPIDWSHRVAMFKEICDRELGKPAQHLQLDAHVKAQLAMQATADRGHDPYSVLTDEELEQAELTGRKLGIDPTRVIEATSGEDDNADE